MEGFESVGNSSVSESSGASAPASTPAVAPSSTPADTGGGSGAVQTGASDVAPPVTPTFTPDFKFKVLDKEHEIPEFLRGAMKDEQTAKQLKELHEKAFGLDVVKPKYQETRKQLEDIRGKYDTQSKAVSRVLGMFEKNDLDSAFKELKISEDQILRYALEKVQYRELPLEQRMALDAQRQEKQRLGTLETQAQDFEQKYYAEATQVRGLQLDHGLAKPEVKQIADSFDAKVGMPGAFRNEVIKRGQLAYYTTGTDISVEQAMNEVLALAGGVLPPGGNQAPLSQAPASAQGAQQAPVQPPVIPNVSGRGASPAKKAITSISDLRERARSL